MAQEAVDYSQVESIAQHLISLYPPEYLQKWAKDFKYIKYQQEHSPSLRSREGEKKGVSS